MKKTLLLMLTVILALLLLLVGCGGESTDGGNNDGKTENGDGKEDGSVADDGLIFELNNDGTSYILVGCEKSKIKENVIIPDTYKGLPVTEIAGSSWYSILPSTITSVSLPKNLVKIGKNAFNECSKLQYISNMPNSVTCIESGAFQSCNSLKTIVLSTELTRIEEDTFYRCDSLESIVIPNNVTFIGENAFSRCGLQSLTLSSKLEEIDENAFSYCNNLDPHCNSLK